MEREGDDLRGDLDREARESLRGEFRGERLPVGLLVGREADRGDLAQVSVSSVGRDRGARGEEQRVYMALMWDSALQRGLV